MAKTARPIALRRSRDTLLLSEADLLHERRDLPIVAGHESIEVPGATELDAGPHLRGEVPEVRALGGVEERALEPGDHVLRSALGDGDAAPERHGQIDAALLERGHVRQRGQPLLPADGEHADLLAGDLRHDL